MSIKYDCYFCETYHYEPSVWETCSYNKDKDKDYWQKEPPCEFSDKACPFYITREQAYNIVRKEVENVKDSGVHSCA